MCCYLAWSGSLLPIPKSPSCMQMSCGSCWASPCLDLSISYYLWHCYGSSFVSLAQFDSQKLIVTAENPKPDALPAGLVLRVWDSHCNTVYEGTSGRENLWRGIAEIFSQDMIGLWLNVWCKITPKSKGLNNHLAFTWDFNSLLWLYNVKAADGSLTKTLRQLPKNNIRLSSINTIYPGFSINHP